MRENFLGFAILFIVIALLFLFPFVATLTDKNSSFIQTNSIKHEPWFLEKEDAKVVFVYFGYVGCSTICAPRLEELMKLYKDPEVKRKNIPFYFVNLKPSQSPALINEFVKSLNENFHGIYATKTQVDTLNQEFNLALQNGVNELSHSSNLFVFTSKEKKYSLEYIFTTKPYDIKQLRKIIAK